MEALAPRSVECGTCSAALAGQPACGDLHVLRPFRDGILLAVVDGLGHGSAAASAARIAGAVLEEHAGEPLDALVRRCHEALRASRGVVMSLGALLPDGRLSWLGVGNVQGFLLRSPPRETAEEALLLRAGVVGVRLPRLATAVVPVSDGDTLVFATDGVAEGFPRGLALRRPAQKAAEAILSGHRKQTDDALVLVARFLGSGG